MAGTFTGIDLTTLLALRTTYLDALTALATMQSYSIAGRSVTRANIGEIRATLAELNFEIRRQQGTARTVIYAGMNPAQTTS